MKIRDNVILDVSNTDTEVDFYGTKIKIEGSPSEGVMNLNGENIYLYGSLFTPPGIFVRPENGGFVEAEYSYATQAMYHRVAGLLSEWLDTIGYIKKIELSDSKIHANLTHNTTLTAIANSIRGIMKVIILYNSENMWFLYGVDGRRFFQQTPFNRGPADYIGIEMFEEFEVPGSSPTPFGEYNNMTYAEVIDYLYKYDGKCWPGTNVPVLFKRAKNYSLHADEKGVWFEKNGEIVTTIFIPPTKPTSVIRIDGAVVYRFGDYTHTVSLNPNIDEFVGNLLAAEFLSDVGDLLSEFNVV